jgi:flagellar basal body rod protein FlgG
MLYGFYLSATGIMANSHRQDVIANNLANSETMGFKRDLAHFMERRPESQVRPGSHSSPLLDKIGGGLLVSPSSIDTRAGELETTDAPLDAAIIGKGYFSAESDGNRYYTRDGRMMVDRSGNLIMASTGAKLLETNGKPIVLDPAMATTLSNDGSVCQNNQPVAKLGIAEITDSTQIVKIGGNLIKAMPGVVLPIEGEIRSGMLERSNVDPTMELTALMETQRQLEANANMIRYQDQSLGRLVNEVGKIA